MKMGKDQKVANSPSSENALFEAAMREAKPLRRLVNLNVKSKSAVEKSVDLVQAPTVPGQGRSRLSAGPSYSNLDKRTANRLRRGQVRIEARLDLHGYTQADAHRAVAAFISDSRRVGRRCILIITGKGSPREYVDVGFMPDREIGVLRRNLPRWLAESPVREMVLHFEPARTKHGGDGAFYVLLRRKN